MNTPDGQRCLGCVFYDRLTVAVPPATAVPDNRGFCCRFPPMEPGALDATKTALRLSVLPVVHPSGWCGEWLERGTL